MNKKILLLSILGCVGFTQAQYIIQYPPITNIVFKQPNLSENWVTASPLSSNWQNTGNIYGCLTWIPDASTVTVLESFTQSSNDCKQDQSRSIQNREQETTSKQYRNVGDSVTETQVITTSLTRTAIGTKENWVTTSPAYTEWTNTGVMSGCSNWSPDASTIDAGKKFPQTATDCKQPQTRTRQNREQETGSKAFRNVGNPVTEDNVITVDSTREATGVKAVPKVCAYGNSSWASVPPNLTITWKETTTPVAERFSLVIPFNSTSYVKDGYLYTKGTGQFAQGSNVYSQLCRQAI